MPDNVGYIGKKTKIILVWQIGAIKHVQIGWEERLFLEVQHGCFHMNTTIFKYIEM